jgi:hypothetical protein
MSNIISTTPNTTNDASNASSNASSNTSSNAKNSNKNSSVTFKDIQKILTKKTDLDSPIDYYQYDLNPKIVNIATGENESDYEQKDSNIEIPETQTGSEIDETATGTGSQIYETQTDISIYDNEPTDIDSNVENNNNNNNLPTEDDTVDDQPPDDSYVETPKQLYTRNPYTSTFVFLIPGLLVVLLILGLRGILSFSTMLNCLCGAALIWFVISLIINYSNKNAPNGHFNEDGSINQSASTASFFNIIDKVLGAISNDGGLINAFYNIVYFFVGFFQESLKIMNIRKLFFLLSLIIVIMVFLYIINKLFPLPFPIPGANILGSF